MADRTFTALESDVIFNTLTWAQEYDRVMSQLTATFEARKQRGKHRHLVLAQEVDAPKVQTTERELAEEMLCDLFKCTLADIEREYRERI